MKEYLDPDTINGLFELIGSWFTWKNAYVLYQEKKITGVYWPTTLFFTLWGIWNLLYYPMLNQWFSFIGGVFLVLGNIIWILLVFNYKYKEYIDRL